MTERDALRKIAELIAPHVSTRFVTGDPLADEIEQIVAPFGIVLRDTNPGVIVQEQPKPSAEVLGARYAQEARHAEQDLWDSIEQARD